MANRRAVSIVDTPGFNDTRVDNQAPILAEITRCIYLSAPGLHTICFVVQIGRFTIEDIDTIKAFVRHFGEALYKYVIVVFTKYDDYKRDCEEDEVECDIHNYLNTLPASVKDFVVTKCGSRVIGFDNTLKGEESKKQVIELLAMVDALVKKNGNSFYSNDDFKKAEEIIQSEMKEEKRRMELEMKEKLEKQQKEIDAAANKKAEDKVKAEMKAFKEEMKEKMSDENLHRKAQESESGLSMFKDVVSVLAPLVTGLVKTAFKDD